MPRILIVDDEGGIRSLLSMAFSMAGYEVYTAADGAEAIALCTTSEPFDVLLSDVIMPSINGHEVVRWVTRNYASTRCVLMTGFDNMDCQECPFISRCTKVKKPFSPNDVVNLVGQVLQQPVGIQSGLHHCAD